MDLLTTRPVAAVILLSLLVASCAKHGPKKPPRPAGARDAIIGTIEAPGTFLTGDYFDELVAWHLEVGTKKPDVRGTTPQRLAIVFNGGTVEKGTAPGESPLLCAKQVSIPPSGILAIDQTAIKDSVKSYFDQEKLNIETVMVEKFDDEPNTTVVYVTDSPKSLGCDGDSPFHYIAPLDHGNINRFDVGFVFVQTAPTMPNIVENIIAAASRSFGVDNPDKAKEMADQLFKTIGGIPEPPVEAPEPVDDGGELPTINPGYVGHQTDTTGITAGSGLSLGKYSAELNNTPGLEYLAAIGTSLPQVPAQNAMDTTPIDDIIKSSLPGRVTVPGLDRVVTIIEISKLAARKQAAAANIPTSDEKIQAASRGLLKPSSLAAIGGIAAMASIAGPAGIPAAIGAASQISENINSEMPQAVDPNSLTLPKQALELPDFAVYLSIEQIADLRTLILTLKKHAFVINENYSGTDREALISMLKVAYSQVYKTNIREDLVNED